MLVGGLDVDVKRGEETDTLRVHRHRHLHCAFQEFRVVRRGAKAMYKRKAQGPSRTCNESKEEEEEALRFRLSSSHDPKTRARQGGLHRHVLNNPSRPIHRNLR